MQQSGNNKRGGRRRNDLSGGIGDVKPQMLAWSATMSANDTTTTTAQAIPQMRGIPNRPNTRQVVEILRIGFEVSSAFAAASRYRCLVGTKNFAATAIAAPGLQEPSVLAAIDYAGGTTVGIIDGVRWYDLTDGAGNGVLVGTDNLYAQQQSAGTTSTNVTAIKVLYRFSSVPVEEFVGIVTSQF